MPVFECGTSYEMLGVDLDGAFAEYIVVPATHVYKVPDSISPLEAAYLEPIAACLAVTKAPILLEQRGLIYGDNRIAELTLRIMNAKGYKNIEIMQPEAIDALPAETYDFIVETLATEDTMQQILHMLKPSGTIILKSRPFKSVNMPVTKIVQKEIKLFGTHYGDFQEGIDLLVTGKLHVKDLFGETYSLEEAIDILSGKESVSEDKKIFFKP
jgi:threonine dehydrogenase-like Zn-dependent dehydrogenase